MKRDEIARIAESAGLTVVVYDEPVSGGIQIRGGHDITASLERFAALIAEDIAQSLSDRALALRKDYEQATIKSANMAGQITALERAGIAIRSKFNPEAK